MPIYEYYCYDCRARVSIFFRTFSAAADASASTHCPTCAGKRLYRLVSRVSVIKSEERRMEGLADDASLMAGLESEDPRALAHFMRRMSAESGEPLDAEMSEVLNRLESGESPDEIEKALPDLGGDDGGMGGMGGMGGLGGMDF